MYRTLCLTLAALGLAVSCFLPFSEALAGKSRLYLAGYLGLNTYPDMEYSDGAVPASGEISVNNSVSFAGALGLRLSRNTRIEAELGYRRADMDILDTGSANAKIGGQLRTTTLLLNGIYDFDIWDRVNPFVSAGLGVAWHDGKIEDTGNIAASVSDSDMALAWTLGGGLRYTLRDGVAMSGSYRYLGTTDIGLESANLEFGSHEFRIGLDYDLYQ
jgi:opacity protein-like surface antigen